MVAADGASTTTVFQQGNTTTITDPAGNWKKYVTDAMNHSRYLISSGNNTTKVRDSQAAMRPFSDRLVNKIL